MDERTSTGRQSGKGKERAGDTASSSSGRGLGNSVNPRLGAAFAASVPASPTLSAPDVTAELSNPRSPSATRASVSSRHGRTPKSSTPAASSSNMDYFSQSLTGGPSSSPTAQRRPARTPTGELWSAHPRSTDRHLPAIREAGRSVVSDSGLEQSSAAERPSLASAFGSARSGGPVYPNQSFSMLTRQTYPIRPPPSTVPVRPDVTRPVGFAPRDPKALDAARVAPIRRDAVEEHLASIANTPVQSPGIAEAMTAHSPFALEYLAEASAFENAYLHPLTAGPPKTTINAKKDVDVMSGRKIVNNYELHEEIGRGVHGKVKKARDLVSGREVAIKIVQRYSKKKRLGKAGAPEDKVKKEVAILKKAQHPNVVRMLEVIDDPKEEKVYIVLEYCEFGAVYWREVGVPEIVILENRRLESEQYGDPDLNEAARNEPSIKQATRRLEVQKQTRPSKRRVKSATNSSFWSLEYGGSSEEEEEEEEASLDITPTPTNASQGSSAPSQPQDSLSREISPREGTKSPTETLENEFGGYRELAFGSPWQHPRHVSASQSAAYATEDPSRTNRKQSVTESIVSQMTDVMEAEVPDEELRNVPTMSINECRKTFRDAVAGLDYLHYQGIIHRDIKPDNLLRASGLEVKISDFGVSYLGKPIRDGEESAETSESESHDLQEETELAKTVGTPAFYAPELCSIDFTQDIGPVTGQIDVWALGVTLYCMLFARTPFQADNEFMLMRRIAEEEIVIPKKRLKAIETKQLPKSPSHGPSFGPSRGTYHAVDKRAPDEWVHERIDDELHDLLKRLLTKNPKKRITIKEIKHHPWVIRGLPNPTTWIDATDPARFDEGKKIEISKEDVAEAVVPLNALNRLKSITSRVGRAVGLGPRSSQRKRGGSFVSASETSSSTSLQTAIETTARDPRRQSLLAGESISDALRALREREERGLEHPLARSVTASPEPQSHHGSSNTSSRNSSYTPTPAEFSIAAPRPTMPDRNQSNISTATSIRTIRASDFERRPTTSPIAEFAEDEATNIDQIQSSQQQFVPALATIFGRRPVSRNSSTHGIGSSWVSPESTSSPETPFGGHTPYGESTVALSNTMAVGELIESLSGPSSRKSSLAAEASRKSSTASQGGRHRSASGVSMPQPSPGWHGGTQGDLGGGLSAGGANYATNDEAATDDEYNQAMDTLNRRRLLEVQQARDQSNASRNAMRQGPPTAGRACPPSPDDDDAALMPPPPRPSAPSSPLKSRTGTSFFPDVRSSGHRTSNPLNPISSASSEDQFNLSQSTSYPSMPSVSSTSYMPEYEQADVGNNKSSMLDSTGTDSSGETLHESHVVSPSESKPSSSHGFSFSNRYSAPMPPRTTSYQSSSAITDEADNDDEDSDEGFLMMSKKRRSGRSGSVSNAQLARRSERSESIRVVRKSGRSGSNGGN